MIVNIAKAAVKKGYSYYPYQAKMIADMLAAPTPYTYNGSTMGTGKTIMTYGYAYNLGVTSMLVICPASLRINWLRESFWGGPNLKHGMAVLSGKDMKHIESREMWKAGRGPSLLVVSYDMLVSNQRLRRYVANRKWDFMVCDEMHNCRNPETQRSQIIMALSHRVDRFQFLSGTPMMKSGADLYPALYSIVPELDYLSKEDHEVCSDYDLFSHTFSYVYNGVYGVVRKRVRNADRLKALLKDRGKFFFRKTKSEVLQDLPDKTYHPIEMSFDVTSTADKKHVNAFLSNFDADSDKLVTNDPIIATLRRELGQAKVASSEVYEFVVSILDAGNPVVLFAYHRCVIDALMIKFKKWNPVKLDGRTNPLAKQQAVDDFQNGYSDVFIGQLQAAGAGITLTRAADAVFYELDWLPGVNEQCCDRLHRISQKNAVNLYFPISQNEFDLKIIKEMIRKQKAIDKVI